MNNYNISTELLQQIKAEQAYHYRIIPVNKKGAISLFKTDHENLRQLQAELEILLGFSLELEAETTENINRYLSTNYRKSNSSFSLISFADIEALSFSYDCSSFCHFPNKESILAFIVEAFFSNSAFEALDLLYS